LGGAAITAGAKLLASKPKDVPALKKALADLLLAERKRVLVVIDDIDRLTPDEVRQLFTVIKALADFPYVTYLLAFDREVATKAINEQTGLPGERYLEKIIQVPFELPRPDRIALRHALFMKLDTVMAHTPAGRFDSMHWHNIFHSGLDPLVVVPRDVVRLTNVLSVTYPAVVGEVNPVDFIAIEALRVFLPNVYDVIRTSPEQFVGHAMPDGYISGEAKQRVQAFHDGWLNEVPELLQSSTKDMIQRLFPRLASIWSNTYYGGASVGEWRRALRICAPEIFPAYFRLSIPQDAVSRSDIDALLAAIREPESFAALLRVASSVKGTNGVSKVRALLERFIDYINDIDAAEVHLVVGALLSVGDELLSATDRSPGMFAFGNEISIGQLVYHLLKKVDPAQRATVFMSALEQAGALRCSQYLIHALIEEVEKADNGQGETLVSAEAVQAIKTAWCERTRILANSPDFIDRPSVDMLIDSWRAWGNPSEAVAWWREAAKSDEGLLKLVTAQAWESRSQSGSDLGVRTNLRLDPRRLEPYGDVYVLAVSVR